MIKKRLVLVNMIVCNANCDQQGLYGGSRKTLLRNLTRFTEQCHHLFDIPHMTHLRALDN